METDWPPMVDGDNGGPSYCRGNRGPDYGEDGASCGVKLRHRFVRVPREALQEDDEGEPAVRRGGGLSRPLRRVGGLSRRLPAQGGRCHPPRLLVLAVDTYSHKIKNLLEPHPEHGRIQFHRLNIKNGSQPEGLIKMTDLLPLAPPFWRSADPPFLRTSTEHLLDSPPELGRIQFHRLNIKNDS